LDAETQNPTHETSCPPQEKPRESGSESQPHYCACGRVINPNSKLAQDLEAQAMELEIEVALAHTALTSAHDHYDNVNRQLHRVRQQLLATRCLDQPLPK